MGTLGRRLDRLEALARPDICPEHMAGPTDARVVDYRDGLRAVSPNPAERTAYAAEEDALDAQLGCPRCGWKDVPPFRIVARDGWSWMAGSAHDEPA